MGEFNVNKSTGGLNPTAGMPDTYPASQVMLSDGTTSVEDKIGNVRMAKLWENPSPTATTFPPQNIMLSNSDYDYLLVIGISAENGATVSTLVQKGKNGRLSYATSTETNTRVLMRTNDTQYAAKGGYVGTTLNNEVLLPIIIYGIKLT